MTANIRTPQRTVSAMQRFAVSQKNCTEAITISPFSLSLPYRTENRRFSALSCTKTGGTQPKLSAACFVVQSCLADADFVVFSNYCLIGTRQRASFLFGGDGEIGEQKNLAMRNSQSPDKMRRGPPQWFPLRTIPSLRGYKPAILDR